MNIGLNGLIKLLTRLGLLYVLLLNLNGFSQNKKSNLEMINQLKSPLSEEYIVDNIIGFWEFNSLINPSGISYENNNLIIDSLSIVMDVSRPDVEFKSDKRYSLLKNDEVMESGTWQFDNDHRVLKFIFDNPKYNIPLDKISPELLEKAKKNGSIIEFTGDVWEIHKISDSRLLIIEHLPHNEFELNYNLRVYNKKTKHY